MNHFAWLIVLLTFATTPAFCTTVVQAPAHHVTVHKRHAQKGAGSQVHASMPSTRQPKKANPVALTGGLIYQEVEVPAPTTPAEVQGKCDAAPAPITKPSEQKAIMVPQGKIEKIMDVQRSSGFHWIGFLKALSLIPRTFGMMERSWVSDVTQQQSLQLADAITVYLAKQAPPQSTVLLLAPPPKAQAGNPLTPALINSLRKSGFGLVESKRQALDAQVLQYQVSRLNGGLIVQLQFNKVEANRFYCINASNDLVAGSPFCVREVR
jgi:hypothetical protein